MKTLVFKLKIDTATTDTLKSCQYDWSTAFRRVYNNLDSIKDPTFLKSLSVKSSKAKEYLIKEVVAFHERKEASNLTIQNHIDKLTKKLQSKDKLYPKEYRHLQYLQKSLHSPVVFGGRSNLVKRSKGLISTDQWKELRLYPMTFYGETSRAGNRFFDFKELTNGNIKFKYEGTTVKVDLSFNPKKHQSDLVLLQQLALDKALPITVKLTHEKLFITFDEEMLNGSKFDHKQFYKDAPNKKTNPLANTAYWRDKHVIHDTYRKQGKLERYLAIDMNPNQLGYIVLENDMTIIEKGSVELDRNITANKRKHELSQVVKFLFNKIKHYKVSYFVKEDLKFSNKNMGNRVSNKKIKNEWCRTLIDQLIIKRCKENKTILREVKPCYSSIIGNLTTGFYDPVAAAYEVGRRGINQFTKQKLFPVWNQKSIANDWIVRNPNMYSNINFGSITDWNDLFVVLKLRKWSVRNKAKTLIANLFNANSNVCLYF